MIDVHGEPTVMDFGLARDFSRQQSEQLTQTGMMIGTPAYMSPEQIEGNPTAIGAEKTDIWSLGVILYELLTGKLPFEGKTIWKLISIFSTCHLCRLRKCVQNSAGNYWHLP